MTPNERDELISAALDGECVDLGALRDALSTPDGRASAAAFLLIRATVAADTIASPRPGFAVVNADPERRRGWFLLSLPRVPAGIAASVAMLAAASAFWIGSARPIGRHAAPGAPATAAATAPAPLSVPAQPGAAPAKSEDDAVPPTPSRVLRFTPGVDWHEGS
jgi:hypothetical protein